METKAANHGELRMALVFRADLPQMTRGKGEGQACHAGLEAGYWLARNAPELGEEYLRAGQTKVVLEVAGLPQLERLAAKAAQRGVRCTLITDAAHTCFPEPTVTCALVGPMSKTDSNAITRGSSMRE